MEAMNSKTRCMKKYGGVIALFLLVFSMFPGTGSAL